MAERVRFHLDEHIESAIARELRRHGIDVTTTTDAGLTGRDDQTHLDFARVERRTIVTRDRDFLRLAAQQADHAGIAFAHPHQSIGDTVRGLILVFELLTPRDMQGHVEYL